VLKRRRLQTIGFAALGFVIAAAIWAYTELTASSPPHLNFLVTLLVLLCPPSFLSAALIDVEPGATGFTLMWLVIASANAALYAVFGFFVGRWLWEER
jgi:hypothetical protein